MLVTKSHLNDKILRGEQPIIAKSFSSETRRASMHSKSSGATPSGTTSSDASGGAVGHSNGSDTSSRQTKSAAKSGFTFDRHMVLVGCQTFQEFFDRHPEVLEHFDKFEDLEIDNVKVRTVDELLFPLEYFVI